MQLALCGLVLIAIVSCGSLLSYEVLRPAAGADAPAVMDVRRWQGDLGAVYDRTPVTPTPSPIPSPSPTPVPPPPESVPYQLVISRIGVNAPVVAKGLDANRVPIVPLNSYQVAWYTFSAQPGTGGNAVFAGHVTWNGRAVFYSLDQLVAGDAIKIDDQAGDELTYTVTDSYMVSDNDANALSVMGPTPDDVITIITCDGTYYHTGDPIFGGAYTARRIVRASLTSEHMAAAVSVGPAG